MRKAFVISLTLLLMVGATTSFARAPQELPRVLQGADITDRPAPVDPNLATSAGTDTFVFGPYDFETGWQGWSDVDYTLNPTVYPHIQNLASVPGSRGNGTLFTGNVEWTGTLGANACGSKAAFPGYDNGTNQLVFKSFTISAGQHLKYAYRADSEAGYDYTYVIISRVGNPVLQGNGSYKYPGTLADRDTLVAYTGYTEGNEDIDLSAATDISGNVHNYVGTSISIIFQSTADGGYSDGDLNYNSLDGMWEMDNVMVGADNTTWDAGQNGWTFGRTAGIGNFAALEPLSTLQNLDPCPQYCGLSGNVVTIYDPSDPTFHPVNQNEAIVSPTLDLTVNSSYPVGSYVMQFDVYANLLLNNGNFYFWHVRYSPVEISTCACLDPNDWSAWLDENTIYYGGGTPSCGTAFQFNVSAKVPGHATKLQMAVGVINYPYYVVVAGGNQSPYFDNISLRAAKVSAPAIVQGPWDLLQDAYPNAATFATAKSTPAKIDDGLNNYSPGRSRTRMGDSLIASVALSCNSDQKVEVDLLFKITPGPCLNQSHPWWVAYLAQPKLPSGDPYAGFAVARCDTAISATNPNAASSGFGTFMGAFHESPPAAGTKYAAYGNWTGYTGGVEGKNVFPDDLFTPGTHIEWVMHTTYIPVKPNGDYYSPDPKYGNGDGDRLGNLIGNQKYVSAGGTYNPQATFVEETSVLPYTTQDGNLSGCASAQAANCFLYVDKSDLRGPQFRIEIGFHNLGVSRDRYDVRASTSAMGNDLGSRFDPLNYANGDHAPGPLPSLLNEVYKVILWNTGSLNSTNFSYGSTATGADAGNAVDLLNNWLKTTTDGKYLWVNGDGNSRFLNRTGNRLTFLNTTLGTVYIGAQYRDKNTAWGINLTGLGPDCTTGLVYGLRGNWCPQRRAYSYIDKYTGSGLVGTPSQNFKYPDAGGTWYASVQNVATTGGFNFRTQNDSWSLDQLRNANVVMGAETDENISDWEAQSLSVCFTGCFANLQTVGVGEPKGGIENRLGDIRTPRAPGMTDIAYSLKSDGHVAVRIYDVAGRLVSTVVDRVEKAGAHTATWDASHMKGGVYFYQIEANGFKSAKKIVFVQ
jgi:hypothetical protein